MKKTQVRHIKDNNGVTVADVFQDAEGRMKIKTYRRYTQERDAVDGDLKTSELNRFLKDILINRWRFQTITTQALYDAYLKWCGDNEVLPRKQYAITADAEFILRHNSTPFFKTKADIKAEDCDKYSQFLSDKDGLAVRAQAATRRQVGKSCWCFFDLNAMRAHRPSEAERLGLDRSLDEILKGGD